MFLSGRIATEDGAPVPSDALVERVCDGRVRQQVHTSSHGDFSMQLGSTADSFLDASGDSSPRLGDANPESRMGMSRRELANCELRASISGFSSSVVTLVDLDTFGSVDVGAITVRRRAKIEGMTLSAIPYKAPKDARKAYEKGLKDGRNGKLASARKYFEKAVEVYPGFAIAWFQLGTVLQKEDQKDAARAAFARATTADSKFLPPYLSLSQMAFEAKDWVEVVDLTGRILGPDPLKQVDGYILDLDAFDYAAAYFYNSVANYKLNKIEDAERSGLKAEHLDLRNHFPQVHLLLAEIFARKSNYATAVSELQIYLESAPPGKDADQVRERLAEWKRLSGSASTLPAAKRME